MGVGIVLAAIRPMGPSGISASDSPCMEKARVGGGGGGWWWGTGSSLRISSHTRVQGHGQVSTQLTVPPPHLRHSPPNTLPLFVCFRPLFLDFNPTTQSRSGWSSHSALDIHPLRTSFHLSALFLTCVCFTSYLNRRIERLAQQLWLKHFWFSFISRQFYLLIL